MHTNVNSHEGNGCHMDANVKKTNPSPLTPGYLCWILQHSAAHIHTHASQLTGLSSSFKRSSTSFSAKHRSIHVTLSRLPKTVIELNYGGLPLHTTEHKKKNTTTTRKNLVIFYEIFRESHKSYILSSTPINFTQKFHVY